MRLTPRILPVGIGLVAALLIAAISAVSAWGMYKPQLSDIPPMPDGDLAIIIEPSGCYFCDVSGMLLGALICPGLPMLLALLIFGILQAEKENR